MQEILFTTKMLAKRWCLSSTTLQQWRWTGKGPEYVKLGRRVLYRPKDVERFEKEQLREHTSHPHVTDGS
ncbi:MAG: helix-turn-helix domain-containing protein [Pseudomonadota bacterium]